MATCHVYNDRLHRHDAYTINELDPVSKFPRNRVYPVSTILSLSLFLSFSAQPTLRPFGVHGHGKIVARARCRACYFRVLIDTSEAVTLANPAENRFAP